MNTTGMHVQSVMDSEGLQTIREAEKIVSMLLVEDYNLIF
jgi:hypothetical protein